MNSLKYRALIILLLIGSFTLPVKVKAQQNVGIGISNPHPSAILHLADTLGKGALIPRTDTNAVLAYVNSLTPNPGIANGLLIYQKSDKVFYYYDGDASKWVPLSGVVGPTGSTGPTGPTGPRGTLGRAGIIRDTNFSILPQDTIGNYFLQINSGRMFEVNPTILFWQPVQPTTGFPRVNWRSTVQGGFTAHISSSSYVEDDIPAAGKTDNIRPIPGMNLDIPVGFDSVGWVVVRAYGSVKKRDPDNDYKYAIFDLRVNGTRANVSQIVGMGPNGALPEQHPEIVSWQIAYAAELSPGTNTVTLLGSQYRIDARTGFIILCDGPGSDTQAHMDVFVMYRRIP